MKRPMRLAAGVFTLTFLFAARVFAWSAQEISDFDKANKEYREGHFQQAAAVYKKLADAHPAAVFYYNLGNAGFRLKALGLAILAYERAQLLDPRNGDIRRNLNYVRGLLEYRVEDKRNWYLRAGEKLLASFTFQEIIFLLALFYFLFAAGALSVLFGGRVFGWKLQTLAVACALFLALGAAKYAQLHWIADAVILSKEAEVRYGPSDTDQVAFRLGEGLKVYVVDHQEDWSRILLTNGDSGWISNRLIAEVRPESSSAQVSL